MLIVKVEVRQKEGLAREVNERLPTGRKPTNVHSGRLPRNANVRSFLPAPK